jgi:O-antigen/teichoic acid export membrane protein
MVAGSYILKTLSLATTLRMVRLLLSFALTCMLARYLGGGGFGQIAVAMAVVSILLERRRAWFRALHCAGTHEAGQ